MKQKFIKLPKRSETFTNKLRGQFLWGHSLSLAQLIDEIWGELKEIEQRKSLTQFDEITQIDKLVDWAVSHRLAVSNVVYYLFYFKS